jgi:hypothetical protein
MGMEKKERENSMEAAASPEREPAKKKPDDGLRDRLIAIRTEAKSFQAALKKVRDVLKIKADHGERDHEKLEKQFEEHYSNLDEKQVEEVARELPTYFERLDSLRANYIKVAESKLADIKKLDIESGSGLPELSSLLADFQKAASVAASNFKEASFLSSRLDALTKIHRKNKLGEGGFSSFDEAWEKKRGLEGERRGYKQKWFGRWRHKDEIGALDEKIKPVDEIVDIEYRTDWTRRYEEISRDFRYYSEGDKIKKLQEDVRDVVVEKIFSRFNRLCKDSLPNPDPKVRIEINEEMIGELNDDYIETFVKPELERKKRELRERIGTGGYHHPWNQEHLDQLENEEKVSHFLGQLKKSFGMNRNDSWSSEKTEAERADVEETFKEFNNLQPPFEDIRSHINFSAGKLNDSFVKMTDFTVAAPAILVSREIADAVSSVKAELAGFMYTWDYEKHYSEDLKNVEEQGRTKIKDLDNFDIKRWKVIRDNEKIRTILGAENVDNTNKFLAEKLAEDMVNSSRSDDPSWDRMYEFLPYHYKDKLPELVLCAFRDMGYSHNFLIRGGSTSEKSLPYLVSQLSQEDIADFENKKISGISELIELIKSNPETYAVRSSFRVDPETGQQGDETNPINGKVEQELMRLCEYFLEQKSQSRRNLAVGVIRGLDLPPSEKAIELITDGMRRELGGDRSFSWECAKYRANGRNDARLMKAFIDNEDIFSDKGVLAKIKEETPDLMKIFLSEKEGDPESAGGMLSKILDITPAELQDLKVRIRDFGEKYHPGLSTFYVPYRIYRENSLDVMHELEPGEVFVNTVGFEGVLRKLNDISKEANISTDELTRGLMNYLAKTTKRTGQLTEEENKMELREENYKDFNDFARRLAAELYNEDGFLKNNNLTIAQEDFLKQYAQDPKKGELLFKLNKLSPLLFNKENEVALNYLMRNFITLAKDETDLKFINSMVGRHGKAAHQMIIDYTRCLESGVISNGDKQIVSEFTENFRILSPEILKGYINSKNNGTTEVFIAHLKTLTEKMIGTESISEEERGLAFYQDLLREVYPNNSGQWTTYENNWSCADRPQDLSGFKIKSRYEIDLLSAAEIKIKEGEALNTDGIQKIKESVLAYSRILEGFEYDSEKANEYLAKELDTRLGQVQTAGGLAGIDIGGIKDVTEKLYMAVMDSIYGTKSIGPADLKKLMILYEFSNFEDIREYIRGTSDRVSRSSNPDYALLCELNTFFADRIKEVSRRIIESGHENELLAKNEEMYFQNFSKERKVAEREKTMNQFQINKLGLTEDFLKQIGRSLKEKTGKNYTNEQLRRIVRLYESISDGLQEKSTTSPKRRTRAFYGQLRAQREKTFQAIRELTGNEFDAKEVHLDEMNLAELITFQGNVDADNFDEQQFASFTAQKLINIFDDEQQFIGGELKKFESASGKEREVLHAYITKTKESANARTVGGVCVCGDNPQKVGERCMWNMENFIQMVFQDPDSRRCQGLVMMHHFSEPNGEKVLAVSVNPSSTYLYSVDEAALFRGVMNSLVDFAQDNNFDKIVLSKNKGIRTNRTGGGFENEMDKLISEVREEYRFPDPKIFSFNPSYQLQEMDVVWKKK